MRSLQESAEFRATGGGGGGGGGGEGVMEEGDYKRRTSCALKPGRELPAEERSSQPESKIHQNHHKLSTPHNLIHRRQTHPPSPASTVHLHPSLPSLHNHNPNQQSNHHITPLSLSSPSSTATFTGKHHRGLHRPPPRAATLAVAFSDLLRRSPTLEPPSLPIPNTAAAKERGNHRAFISQKRHHHFSGRSRHPCCRRRRRRCCPCSCATRLDSTETRRRLGSNPAAVWLLAGEESAASEEEIR
ncbi:hypothetical protein Droror1_Dr00024781 [Drosera rotundifolia]